MSEPNLERIREGHREIAQLVRTISDGIDPQGAERRTAAASCLLDLAKVARRVAPIVEVCERFGWNGVENSKILTDFLEDVFQERKRLWEALGYTGEPPADPSELVKALKGSHAQQLARATKLETDLAAHSPPTPEDVARDAKRVWNAIPTSMHGEFLDGAWVRLRDGAARAQGLEADLVALRVALAFVMLTGDRRDGHDIHCVCPARTDKAGAEHATACAEARAALGHPSPGAVLLERLHTAEAERDAARQESESLSEENQELTREVTLLREAAHGDRERVATLERALAAEVGAEQGTTSAGWRDAASRADALTAQTSAECDAWKTRAEAAERRVAEYEETLMQAGEALGLKSVTGPALVEAVRKASTSHPAPAGLLEAVGHVLDLAASPFNGGPTAWNNAVESLRAAYDAAKGGEGREDGTLPPLTEEQMERRSQYTREVLGRIATEKEKARKWDEAVARAKDSDAIGKAAVDALKTQQAALEGMPPVSRGLASLGVAAVAGAAYVVAGLDTPPSGPGGGETKCHAPSHINCGCNWDPPQSCRFPTPLPDALERDTCSVAGACAFHSNGGKVGEHCAPWTVRHEPVVLGTKPFVMDPDVPARAVERTHRTVTEAQRPALTPESLAAVVEGACQDWGRMARSGVVSKNRYLGRIDGAREVLRCALSGQVPRVLLESRVRYVLEQHVIPDPEEESDHNINGTLRECMEQLGLTLPGGEAKAADLEDRNPRVTPDGPALADSSEKT